MRNTEVRIGRTRKKDENVKREREERREMEQGAKTGGCRV
jgi:hypothetical protein